MTTIALNINDVAVRPGPVEYVCYGLGSCIGLFIADRHGKLYGGAHIPVADHDDAGYLQGAGHLLDKLLSSFSEQGSDLTSLRAKLTGGAQVYASALEIGYANSSAVKNYLIGRRIYIAGADVGGRVSRTARFSSVTELLHISTSDKLTYSI